MSNVRHDATELEEKDEDATAMEEHRLYSSEVYWRDHYFWLKERGYSLRPRYHPDWVASWKGTGRSRHECEDGQVGMTVHSIMPATRISDGAQVVLKRFIGKNAQNAENEITMGQLFSSEPHRSQRSNHCAPVYDTFFHPGDGTAFLVTPLLGEWDEVDFETIGEALEFFRQIFEGLNYMHSVHIAHNDVKFDNIMMDAMPLFGEPFHPIDPRMTLDFSRPTKPRSRTLHPVKYYYIDFAMAIKFNPEDPKPRLPIRPGGYGGDLSVPEFKIMTECDPFPVDVYRVGNVIRNYFTDGNELGYEKKRGFDFMRPLLQDMCQEDPAKRPTMPEVVSRFEALMKGLSDWKLRSRVVPQEEIIFQRLARFPGHWTRQLIRCMRRTPAVPIVS